MRTLGRQAENVRRELHRGITLRTSSGDAQARDGDLRALLDLLHALTQGIRQAFEDRPVNVRAGMHVAEADHRALGFHTRIADTGRPVGLQHQPHGARRHGVDQRIEELLGLHTLGFGLLHFPQAELVLEPADHPVAAINHHLAVVLIRHRGRVRRNQRDDFQVARPGAGDRRRGAVGKAHGAWVDDAGTHDFAGLVGTRGDQRQPLGNAGVAAGLGADVAEGFTGLVQARQLLGTHRQRLPFPVGGCGPAQALEVERQVTDATAHRIDKAPTQAMGEKPREQQKLVGRRPDLRLVAGDPVGLGLGAKVVHCGLRADQFEQPAPRSLDATLDFGLALIEPQDRRAQRLALGIDVDHRAALGGQGYTGDL
ncbi:hypothetical protein D3C84_385640 [compost metagenome]